MRKGQYRLGLFGFGVAIFLLGVSMQAWAADKLTLSNSVFQDIEIKNADGKSEIKRIPVETAFPGSELLYVITYKNTGDKPAEDVVISNPLSKELLYKDQSANGNNATVTVSVNGGKNYGEITTLRIPTTDGADRPAKVEDITDIQFKLSKPVLPEESGTVSFWVVLK